MPSATSTTTIGKRTPRGSSTAKKPRSAIQCQARTRWATIPVIAIACSFPQQVVTEPGHGKAGGALALSTHDPTVVGIVTVLSQHTRDGLCP
jgi:hypothetical protein